MEFLYNKTVFYIATVISFLLLSVNAGDKTKRCKFPRSWKGTWYQKGLGVFEIKSRSIDGKGQCDRLYNKKFYLLKNKEADCIQCLLMFEMHRNILQYRESFCFPTTTSPKAICDNIRVESAMHTIVREKSSAVLCPITQAYYFTYDDKESGTCKNPTSYAKPCVGNQKYQFNFRHCESSALLHNKDFVLTCLAVWKEGSENFMYGQLSGAMPLEENYRCFKYEVYGTDVFMSMSIDSSCRGIFSARNGLFTMHFVQDIYGWPPSSCYFPTWLRGLPWRDVGGKNVYELSEENLSMYTSTRGLANTEMKSEYRCIDIIKQKEDTVVLLTFATIRCESRYKCVKIKLLGELAMSLQIGDAELRDNKDDMCQSGTQYTQHSLILADTDNVISCPHPAIYPSRTSCSGSLNVGCYNSTNIVHKTTCPGSKGFSFDCKAFWEDGSTTYVIGHLVNSADLQCYSFNRSGTTLEWRSDPKCEHVSSRNYKYKDVEFFSIQTDKCFTTKDKSTNENEVIKWSDPHKDTVPRQRHNTIPAMSPDHKKDNDKKHQQTAVHHIDYSLIWPHGNLEDNDDYLVIYSNEDKYDTNNQFQYERKTIPEYTSRGDSASLRSNLYFICMISVISLAGVRKL